MKEISKIHERKKSQEVYLLRLCKGLADFAKVKIIQCMKPEDYLKLLDDEGIEC
jgi:hypothetical protein